MSFEWFLEDKPYMTPFDQITFSSKALVYIRIRIGFGSCNILDPVSDNGCGSGLCETGSETLLPGMNVEDQIILEHGISSSEDTMPKWLPFLLATARYRYLLF